jgi:predicted phage terminase large subunit-like protein
LRSLPKVERERLLGGNWHIRYAAGEVFKREWFPFVDICPASSKSVRFWDRAGSVRTEKNTDPDWTVGTKMSKDAFGNYYIEDVVRFRETASKVERYICNIAESDGREVDVVLEKDPGQAGKAEFSHYTKLLDGYKVKGFYPNASKLKRSLPFAAQVEAGNVYLKRADWNNTFIGELVSFSGEKSMYHDDQVDSVTGAYNYLATKKQVPFVQLDTTITASKWAS